MKKALLILAAAALFLTGCNGPSNTKPTNNAATNDSSNVATYQEGEPTAADEKPGMDPYQPVTVDIQQIASKAEPQDSNAQVALYVIMDQKPGEYDLEGIYSVWLADNQTGTATKILTTNPTVDAPWDQMEGKDADAVEVPMHLIGSAAAAYLLTADGSKIIVEGCPDARNIWTYIIDTKTRTAKQLPTTEGVNDINFEKQEIIASLYGYYPEGGRYTYSKAYSFDGKYLRQETEPVQE